MFDEIELIPTFRGVFAVTGPSETIFWYEELLTIPTIWKKDIEQHHMYANSRNIKPPALETVINTPKLSFFLKIMQSKTWHASTAQSRMKSSIM